MIQKIMKEKNIDAYLIQETHMAGDFKKALKDDFFIIYLGPEEQPWQGANGGDTIILSLETAHQWNSSEKK